MFVRHILPGNIIKVENQLFVIADQYVRDKFRERVIINLLTNEIQSISLDESVELVNYNLLQNQYLLK